MTDHSNPTDQSADRPTDHASVGDRPPTDRPAVSMAEAAARLGITENAVRQRIKRGTLTGYKTAYGWSVELTDQAIGPATDQPTDRPRPRPTSDRSTDQDAATVLRELLAEERAKSDRLLEAATVWQARAVQLEQRLKQLTAGAGDDRDSAPVPSAPPGTTNEPEPTPATPSSVRSWWRRLWGGA